MNGPHILLIDNYDSFTYNIVALLEVAGAKVTVRPVEKLLPAEIFHYPWSGILIGPGPGHPSLIGDLLPPFLPPILNIPMLGICLGHQYIVYAHGGVIEPMKRPYFGIQKEIYHKDVGLFEGLPNPLPVGLYNALHASHVPAPLEVIAQDAEGHCMAVRHPDYPLWGVQFHPDSILTPHGGMLLRAWLTLVQTYTPQESV